MSGGEDSFNINDPDEGFSSGASNSSQPSGTKTGGSVGQRGGSLNSSSSSIKKAITARLSRDKEKERVREREAEKQELCLDQQAAGTRLRHRQQSPPGSIKLDAIHLSPIKKHLSFPAGHPLVRTGSASSSKSFDCMNLNLNGGEDEREESAGGSDKETGPLLGGSHHHSTVSLQEEHLNRPEESQALLSPGAPLTKQSRSPSFNMQIISQV
ncbi:hypothetical protein ILYODFUR_019214 [Ilyodon furcidens]|uniref:Uncharacterized protein n=1 Tax=Ilyodon furcidens TaxID=33524 RepID=A0ABV0V4B6_9TELE